MREYNNMGYRNTYFMLLDLIVKCLLTLVEMHVRNARVIICTFEHHDKN
jgi:hypothetical protein